MPGVTPEELADVMCEAGKAISVNAIRYHCRDPRGMLFYRALRFGRAWLIPADDADWFARTWQRHGSLRK